MDGRRGRDQPMVLTPLVRERSSIGGTQNFQNNYKTLLYLTPIVIFVTNYSFVLFGDVNSNLGHQKMSLPLPILLITN